MPISWNAIIFKFRWNFVTNKRRIVSGQTFHMVFCGSPIELHTTVVCKSMGSPLFRGNKRNTDQWASTRLHMAALSRHNSSLIGRKYPVKFENDCISRSGHRFKITKPNLMILVSLLRKMLYLMVSKNMIFVARKVLKICRSAFLGTPGMLHPKPPICMLCGVI